MLVKMIVGLGIFCCLVVLNLAEDFHEKMTPEERLNVFHTDKTVPEYEVVPIHWPKSLRRGQTSGAEVVVSAFGEDIKLLLSPVDGVLAGSNTPVYMARQDGPEMRIDRYTSVLKDIYTNLFEDTRNGASLVVSKNNNGGKKIVGTISSKNLAIKPIPERLIHDALKQRKTVLDNITYDDDYHFHVIHKINQANSSNLSISYLQTLGGVAIPDVIYPEVLVVVDHSLYKLLGSNVWSVIPYVLAFWNGVDLKYRTLNNPKWRLNIAGIVLSVDPVLSYIEDYKRQTTKLEIEGALDKGGSFWFEQNRIIPIESYDLIGTMTAQHLCSAHDSSQPSKCNDGILGVAYYACACKINRLQRKMSKVALIHDDGAYDGIHTAAHELGHLFGADHDDHNIDGCTYHDGYIMAATPVATPNSHFWSRCSVNEFRTFFATNPSCLYNKPDIVSTLPPLLPGKYLDAESQCKRVGFETACQIGPDICDRLKCINGSSRRCQSSGSPAADGTPCGNERICLRGSCITE